MEINEYVQPAVFNQILKFTTTHIHLASFSTTALKYLNFIHELQVAKFDRLNPPFFFFLITSNIVGLLNNYFLLNYMT